MKVGIVSQYTEVYCDYGARARLDRIAIQWPAKPRYSKAGQQARARGALGARLGARGRRAGGALGRAGSRGAQALGHRSAQGRGSGAQGARWERHGTGAAGNGRAGVRSRRAAGARQAGRRRGAYAGCPTGGAQALDALQAGAGRAGLLRAVHSVHSACFLSGCLGIVHESIFGHYS